MTKTDLDTNFNKNFKYLRYISDVTMAVLAQLISEHFIGKALSVQQIQSYEQSSEPRQRILIAIRDFYREKDSTITTDMLLERDFESENYKFPLIPDEYQEEKNDELDSMNSEIEALKKMNDELIERNKKIDEMNYRNSETMNLLAKKIS